jgi:hypothetical protein
MTDQSAYFTPTLDTKSVQQAVGQLLWGHNQVLREKGFVE